jgi:hypothetical protein
MKLIIRDLEEKVEAGSLIQETNDIINIFLNSINDWPISILTLEDYEKEVENFINGETKKANIEIKSKEIDLNTNAWNAESLCQIVEVFCYFDNNYSLKEIIEELKTRVSKSE